jgi:hypothetical protein
MTPHSQKNDDFILLDLEGIINVKGIGTVGRREGVRFRLPRRNTADIVSARSIISLKISP